MDNNMPLMDETPIDDHRFMLERINALSESLANVSNENTILKGEIAYLETRNDFYKNEIIEKKSDINFLNKRLEKLEDINQKLTENLHKLVMQKDDN
tara:strand:- start:185 stop:475 length:291 start_codon:yes stop_codon:yes gene_type:complete